MDNFNRHFPIRPDAFVSSRVRTFIMRGRWLPNAGLPSSVFMMYGWGIRKKIWDEIVDIFLLLIVGSGPKEWDQYRYSYRPFPCSRFLRPIDPILDYRFD
jgi:hypothetical protein